LRIAYFFAFVVEPVSGDARTSSLVFYSLNSLPLNPLLSPFLGIGTGVGASTTTGKRALHRGTSCKSPAATCIAAALR